MSSVESQIVALSPSKSPSHNENPQKTPEIQSFLFPSCKKSAKIINAPTF